MLKIIEIKERADPWKPAGKTYTVYSVKANVEYEGKKISTVVKTFSKKIYDSMNNGSEFNNIEKKTYQGKTELNIRPEKQDGGYKGGYKSQKASYTLKEFEAVMDRARDYANDTELINAGLSKDIVFERYVNNALMYGVKVNKIPENKESKDVKFDDVKGIDFSRKESDVEKRLDEDWDQLNKMAEDNTESA
jgi:hypothetical protein